MRHPRKLAPLMLSSLASAAVFGSILAGKAVATDASSPAIEQREGRKECQEVPNCRTVMTSMQYLKAGQPVTRTFACPAGTYFWNWSAIVGQHVQVILRDTRLDKKKHEIAATFEYYAQTGNGTGRAQVFLGCSATPTSSGKLKIRRWGYGWNPPERP